MADERAPGTEENKETEPKTPEETLAWMKQNMVPKSELEAARREYNQLFQDVCNGKYDGKAPQDDEKEDGNDLKKKADAAVKELVGGNQRSACAIAEDLLMVDDLFVKKGQRSIFEPSKGARDFEGTRQSAQRTRELLESALEKANGDDATFCSELGSKLRDVI